MTRALEQEFHQAIVNIYKTAKRDLHYNATRFLQMVSDEGGLAAAKQLLHSNAVSEGFTTLWLSKRLGLSVEAHVIDPRFVDLFTSDEVATARRRLEEHGYSPEQ